MIDTRIALRIGTRGSELALYQARLAARHLTNLFPELEIEQVIIKTTGDRRTDVALADVGKIEGTCDKGVFIKELETALDDGSIDLAVHSLKDLPTVLDPRFKLAAVLERAAMRDVLITRSGHKLESLPTGTRIGTSSVRRARQVQWLRPDLQLVDLRGNVPTRLQKLAQESSLDAILLAEAGLTRLGFLPESAPAASGTAEPIIGIDGLSAWRLEESEFYPAAGQGAIGLEIRASDSSTRALVESINHGETWTRITAEREFLRLLEAGCHTPVGVASSLHAHQIHLRSRVFPEQGGNPKTSEAVGEDPLSTALELFQSLK